MRHKFAGKIKWFVAIVFVLACSLVFGQSQTTKKRWIIKLKPGQQTIVNQLKILQAKYGKSSLAVNAFRDDIKSSTNLVYVLEHEDFTFQKLKELQDQNVLEYFEVDAKGYATAKQSVEPNDPIFNKQWYLYNDGTLSIFGIQARAGADIAATDAWEITRGDSAVTVAILDTGISLLHPEFKNRLWVNNNEVPNNNKDDDNNGYIDDIQGWNFVADDPNVEDDNGHGTAIAGAIGANPDNAAAISGINWKSKLMICKVLERDQSGYYSDWAAGIYYAVRNGANIINMSVAGEEDLRTLADAVQYAYDHGVLVVCSISNDNSDRLYYPAGYSNTLAIGSTDPDDARSISFNGNFSFGSNFGNSIDLVAPGNVIYGLNRTSFSANTLWGGTSMSSAVVTGVASLLLSIDRNLTPGELTGILVSTSNDRVGKLEEDLIGWDKYYGFGRVNAYEALMRTFSKSNFPSPDNLSLYPNPASEEINISVLLSTVSSVTIKIIDLQGKTWFKQIDNLSSPLLNETISLLGFQSSVYAIIVEQEGRKFFKRFVVVR